MKKNACIFLIVFIGGLFTPKSIHICGSTLQNSVCEKKIVHLEQKSCCKKETLKKITKKECDGKCNHQNCNISSVQTFVIVPEIFNIENNKLLFTSKKAKFFNPKTNITSGFSCIWIPPVIA